MSVRAAVVLVGASLCAACGEAPKEHGPTPNPAADPNDPLVGTWARDGAATYEASRVHLDRLAALRPESERAALLEEARAELVDSPWTLVVAADGTLVIDALTRTPGTGELEQQQWLGSWTRTDAEVELAIDSTRAGADAPPELTKLTGALAGDRLTFGGPPGNPRGLVLEFERAPE
jgi:hypothetical protein